MEDRVATHCYRRVHVGGRGIHDGHASRHERVEGAAAQETLEHRELLPVVHAGDFSGIRHADRLDPAAVPRKLRDHVGEVDLALGVPRVRRASASRAGQSQRGVKQ